MSSNVKFNIDNKQFSIGDGKLNICILGWFADDKLEKDRVRLVVDGKAVPFKFEKENRSDVIHSLKLEMTDNVGFKVRAQIPWNENISSIQLGMKESASSERYLAVFSIGSKKLKKMIKNQVVQYNIDHIVAAKDGDKDVYNISGWVISNYDTKVKIKLEDENGNEVPMESFSEIVRSDLVTHGYVDNEEKAIGFGINVEDTNCYVVFSTEDGNNVKKFHVGKTFKKRTFRYRLGIVKKMLKHATPKNAFRLVRFIMRNGFKDLKKNLMDKLNAEEDSLAALYPGWYEKHKVTSKELAVQAKKKFSYSPKFSILVPTYKTPIVYLREMIDSVVCQSYSNWELCIADGSGNGEDTKELREVLDDYAAKDSRIVVKYLENNEGISGNTNAALAMATGDIISLFDHDDLLEPNALYEIVKRFQDEKVGCVYTDEDKIVGPKWENVEPNFKPDFNVDLLRSHNYITHFFSVRKEIMDKVGGFKSKYDGAQDYDVILRCSELSEKVEHIPMILYHWRMHQNSTAANPESKWYCVEAGQRAVTDHLERLGIDGEVLQTEIFCTYRVKYKIHGEPLVSIIIPNKDHIDDLDVCVRSVIKKSTYRNFEIIIVENNSTDEKTFEYYEKLEKEFDCVKVVKWDREFNYSAINNFGVKYAKGEYLLLLNNDTEIINKDSIEDMLGICQRKDVGIVGAKLLYEDDTVQHAGVVVGLGGIAGHTFIGLPDKDYGYVTRAFVSADYSAVTAACLMVRKEVYDEVNGLEEKFAVAFNDIDFCMKVREKGYLVVYDAFSKWHHYESKSRGADNTKEKAERFQREIDLFESKWPDILNNGDPYYNRNLSMKVDRSYMLDKEEF